jgi:RNA polymerase sigma factor (sigma-70 family)
MDAACQIEGWYRQHGEAVHRRCARILGDQALAWDATQETFIRAFRAAVRFRGDSSVLTWLFAIADRRALTLLAQQRALSSRAERASQHQSESPVPSLERRLQDIDLLRRVLTAVDDELARIAVLRYLDELDQDEIAVELGISRKTVQRKLARFHKSARKVLHLKNLPGDQGSKP